MRVGDHKLPLQLYISCNLHPVCVRGAGPRVNTAGYQFFRLAFARTCVFLSHSSAEEDRSVESSYL